MADNKKRRLTESTEEIQLLKDKLEILKELKTSCESSSGTKTLTLDELSLPFPCREVADLSPSSIQSNIESLVLEIAHSILAGNGSSFDVPSRSAANKLYVSELDRILLKDITAKIIQLIHQLSQKGMVVGRLIFDDNGDMIDCTKGLGGKAIPPNIDRVENMQSDALFILLVEKDAAYTKLAEDRFYNRFPCIIVKAKGQPDVSTSLFLRKMKNKLKLPVLALMDSDPYGLKILSAYGNIIPDIKWLGVRPSDLDKYKIPEQCRLPMTEEDIKTAKDMLEEDFVKKNPCWVEELTLMLKTKQKADIQALSTFGFQYLTEVYLPLKLQQQDWL